MNEAEQLLRRALEAWSDDDDWYLVKSKQVMDSIRTYLANQETAKDEAVAWVRITECGDRRLSLECMDKRYKPLYLHPAKIERKPMTEEEIFREWMHPFYKCNSDGFVAGVRYAEKHYGITEEQ